MSSVAIPGVTINEVSSGAISIVHDPSCVPILILSTATTTAIVGVTDGSRKISSLAHFVSLASTAVDDDKNAVDIYFKNGGGPCYFAIATELSTVLNKAHDATLVVAGGNDISSNIAGIVKNHPRIFFLLDTIKEPTSAITDTAVLVGTVGTDNEKHVAWYCPKLSINGSASDTVFASYAVAGAYCTADRAVGPWKAPANVEIIGAVPSVPISNTDNEALMGDASKKSINPIRGFLGRPAVIWGARTGCDETEIDYKYVTVRRTVDMIERDIADSLRNLVFRPNNEHTWELARSAVDNYLRDIWKRGGLAGDKEADAFFVQVAEVTTEDNITNGIMNVAIHIAPVHPAEFITITVSQDLTTG